MELENVNGIWFRVESIGITIWQKKMMWAIFDVILLGIPRWTQFLKSRKYMTKNIGCNILIVG
jgi:hypothetical protein